MTRAIKHPWQERAVREASRTPGICVYVDNSNLYIEGGRLAEKQGEDRGAFRLNFDNFFRLIRQDRTCREVVWGGSIPPPDDTVWKHLHKLGIEPDLLERARSGEQDTVDQLVQLRMHRHVRKYRDQPGVICLCTGDGAGYYREEGFLYDIEQFVEEGWALELYSWTHCCHRKLMALAKDRGHFVPLERFYSSITFVDRGRRSVALDLDLARDLTGR